MKKITKVILGILVLLILAVFVFAKVNRISHLSWGPPQVNQSMFSNEAINGYDAVAYFNENQAVAGNEKFSYQWKNAHWKFSSEENLQLFKSNPERYTPEFGGYCAFAVSKGFTANIDPEVFGIVDNKLYLFDNEGVKSDWEADLAGNLARCNSNWNQVH
ncbi:MAG: hypothetical protein DHS20C17_05210 [Cyclobacteriaceae bacterium]|nr:MAG: hypothetical protein DHS20C17_05210 [Cyclobacteriaceae bacterium]